MGTSNIRAAHVPQADSQGMIFTASAKVTVNSSLGFVLHLDEGRQVELPFMEFACHQIAGAPHPLDKSDQEALLALPLRVISLRPQEFIVREGDRPQNSCLIVSGLAFRHKMAGNGGRQIFSIHMKGDLADLQNSLLGIADHNLQALNHVEAALIPVEAIQDIAFTRPAIGRAMWYETLVDASIFREWTLNVGRRDARTRAAHMLCEFALRLEMAGLGERCHYELPMTQEQLADALGLTSVHTNRTLMALGDDGLISRSQRSVRIVDWPRLMEVGDFDPAYLHLNGAPAAVQ